MTNSSHSARTCAEPLRLAFKECLPARQPPRSWCTAHTAGSPSPARSISRDTSPAVREILPVKPCGRRLLTGTSHCQTPMSSPTDVVPVNSPLLGGKYPSLGLLPQRLWTNRLPSSQRPPAKTSLDIPRSTGPHGASTRWRADDSRKDTHCLPELREREDGMRQEGAMLEVR